jgi:hypothetical protein
MTTTSTPPTIASERFAALVAGRTDAWGLGSGGVVRKPLTVDHYQAHLAGADPGLGVFPMLDDNTVRFAAIDLDEPNFDLARNMQRLVPGSSWVERSRSGNAHVWVFFDSPCPAWVARGILRNATEALGRSEVEVFPKQDRLREGMVGNYINLPYHGFTRPILARPLPESTHLLELPLTHFLHVAQQRRTDPASWERRARAMGLTPPQDRPDAEWGTQPQIHECALYIAERAISGVAKINTGSRHQVLFRVACMYLNYRDWSSDEAYQALVDLNFAGVTPPLPYSELNALFQNAVNGRYTSTGCDDPLMATYVRPDCPIATGSVGQ